MEDNRLAEIAKYQTCPGLPNVDARIAHQRYKRTGIKCARSQKKKKGKMISVILARKARLLFAVIYPDINCFFNDSSIDMKLATRKDVHLRDQL